MGGAATAALALVVAATPRPAEAQFSRCDGNWVPYQHNGLLIVDPETWGPQGDDDMTYGGQKTSGFSDMSGGFYPGNQNPPSGLVQGTFCNPAVCLSPPCPPGLYAVNCGPDDWPNLSGDMVGTFGWFYSEGPLSGVGDDVLCLRMRVDNRPTQGGGSLANSHWNFLIDAGEINIGGPAAPDGWKEFWLDLNGRQDTGCSTGCLDVQFENNPNQEMTAARFTVATYGQTNWRAVVNDGVGGNDGPFFANTQPNNQPWSYEWWVEIWVPVTDLRTAQTGGTQVVLGPTHPMRMFISTGTSNVDPLQTDCLGTAAHDNPNPPCCNPDIECNIGQETPVTLASFSSQPVRGGIQVEWWTATETANAGFELWATTDAGGVKVSPQLIASAEGDSLTPQHYSYFIAAIRHQSVSLTDLDRLGQQRYHGPFEWASPTAGCHPRAGGLVPHPL